MKILKIPVLRSIEIQNYGQIVQIFILGDNLSFFFAHVSSSFSSEQHLFNVGTCQPSCASSVLLHRSYRSVVFFARNMSVSCYFFAHILWVSCVFLHKSCWWSVFFFHRKWISTSIYHKWSIKGNIQLRAYWTVIDWTFIGYFISSYLQNSINFLKKCEFSLVGQVPRALFFFFFCSFPSCSRVQNVFLNFLIVQHSIYKWLSEIEGYRWLAPFHWSSTKKKMVN